MNEIQWLTKFLKEHVIENELLISSVRMPMKIAIKERIAEIVSQYELEEK